MLIDCHIHVRKDNSETMVHHMDSLGIDKALLMSFDECGNEDNFQIQSLYPERFLVDCNLKTTPFEDIESYLVRCRGMGAVGLGEFMLNRRLDDPYIQRAFAVCQDLSMPVTVHMSPEVGFSYGLVDDASLPLLEESLKRFPHLTLIGHSQTFWIEISEDAPRSKEERNSWGEGPVKGHGRLFQLMERYENLWCDLSAGSASHAIMRDEEKGLEFVTHFSSRLMFGTDLTGPDPIFPLRDFLLRNLDSSTANAIFCDNFQRCFPTPCFGHSSQTGH